MEIKKIIENLKNEKTKAIKLWKDNGANDVLLNVVETQWIVAISSIKILELRENKEKENNGKI